MTNNVITDLGNAIKRDDVPDFRAGDTESRSEVTGGA
jgi:hypothetical protein